jgi:flagellar protein FliT
MSPSEVLSSYERIVELTRKMADAARDDEWDDFSLLEDECGFESKRMLETFSPALTGADHRRKLDLLKQILANDREIRAITEPWTDQVASVMKGLPTARPASLQAAC